MKKTSEEDRSGSCAICILIVDKKAYAINVGDSRAILSKNHGKVRVDLSDDHRPDAVVEKDRIINNGG